MCGIVAIASRGAPVDPDRLRAAMSALAHRGPDGEGTWFSPDRRFALGHTRLALVDRARGQQPMASGELAVALNGEIYNHAELRETLRSSYTFRTRSDCEVLLPLYRERGAALLEAIQGEFALTLYDGQGLFAARDRLGLRPLFYAEGPEGLVLASEVKALAAAGVELIWDEESLYSLHRMGVLPPGRTLFAGVRQLPPGHCLRLDDQGLRVWSYWRLGDVVPRDAEALPELLLDATRVRARAEQPVALALSGGLDSSTVLAMADTPLTAYTLAPEEDPSEALAAGEIARALGVRHELVPVRARDLADSFADAAFHAEGAFANTHVVARFLLSRRLRDDGFRVMLNGDGADELFAGYPHARVDAGLSPGAESGPLLDGAPGDPSLPAFLALRRRAWAPAESLFDVDFWRRHRDATPERAALQALPPGLSPLRRGLVAWMSTVLPDYLLGTLGDRVEMAHGIEGRAPFLDHRVVEASLALPDSALVDPRVVKPALRQIAQPWLPPAALNRPKRPFFTPPLASNPALLSLLMDAVESAAFRQIPCYNALRVAAFLELALPGLDPARVDPLLNTLLSLALVGERLGVRGSGR